MQVHIYEIATVMTCLLAALAQKFRPREHALPRPGEKWNWRVWLPPGRFWLLVALAALPLFMLSAFRNDVGTDYWHTYRPMYDILASGKTIKYTVNGVGRWILFSLIYRLGGGHVWFFFITSALVIGFFFWGIYRQSAMPVASVALFVLTEAYFASMNVVMQYVGLAFVFFGLVYVQKQSFWKYAVFVAIGVFFHPTTIIMLPLYFLSKLKFKYGPLFGMGLIGLLSLLNGPLTKFLSFLVAQTPYYNRYVGSTFQLEQRFYPARIFIHIVVLGVALLFFYKKESCRQNPFFRFCLYIELAALFLVLNRNVIPLTDRLLWSLEITPHPHLSLIHI